MKKFVKKYARNPIAVALVIALMGWTSASAGVIYDFNDGTALDGAGVGASMVASNIAITTVDIVGQDGSRSSTGAGHKTNIFSTWHALGINDAVVTGNEYGSFDSGEAWEFTFNADVYLTWIDLAGQGPGAQLTISSAAFADIVLDYVDAASIHDLGNVYVPAGAMVVFDMTSPTNAADTSLRISTLTVEPAIPSVFTTHGTPYAWLDSFYTELVSALDYENADTADSDADTMAAWAEYRAGTIPTNTASVLLVNSVEVEGSNCIVSWQSVTGTTYSVSSTDGLDGEPADWATQVNNIAGLEMQTSHTSVVSAASDAFFKVGIEKREIYLLIGQSNMAGRAPIETQDEVAVVGCELFRNPGDWVPAANPLNLFSTIRKDVVHQKLNPGYGFALRMRELRPDLSLGLVVNARGGTAISEWAKGTTYYNDAVSRTKAAIADNGRLAGILWHQGESDGSSTNSYMGKLTNLIANLRFDLDAPDLPFIAGLVEMDEANYPGTPRAINEIIIQLPSVVSNTAVASSVGLGTIDGTHFDSAGQRELGRRYADALLSLE
jgi:hypothetical protein